jgi:hypothetical protein
VENKMTSGKHRGKLYLVEIKTASGNYNLVENKTSSGKQNQ